MEQKIRQWVDVLGWLVDTLTKVAGSTPTTMTTGLSYSAITHTGLVRTNNEDSFVAKSSLGLWVVADGMGGQEAGEVASAIAATTIHKLVSKGNALADAIRRAHKAVQEASYHGVGSKGMGTTIVAAQADIQAYEVAWVGDSRAYLWDGQALTRLTRDHSLVQELLDAGAIRPDEADSHPQRHVITQSVGVSGYDEIRVDKIAGRWELGQWLMLCSDGLTSELSDTEIADLLATANSPREATQQLVTAALNSGGQDNITIEIIAGPEEIQQGFSLPGLLKRLSGRNA